jgi:hypothetical protein
VCLLASVLTTVLFPGSLGGTSTEFGTAPQELALIAHVEKVLAAHGIAPARIEDA